MAYFHVIHTYLCGHFDSNPMAGATSPQYVFVDSGCSNFECSHTDTKWLKEQGTSPSPKDMSVLAKHSRQLTNLQNAAASYVTGLEAAEPYKLQCLADLGFPNLLDLAFADDPQEHADAVFHLSTIKDLLNYARQFAKSSKTRPFFDFCMGELAYFLGDANAADRSMIKALAVNATMEKDPERVEAFCRWPGSYHYHEPGFGVKELNILRAAGQAGKEILQQPLNVGTLHLANLFIRTYAQQGSISGTAAPKGRRPPPLKLALPSEAAPSQSPEAWIAQEEAAFVAELKRVAVKKIRKVARQGRVKKLARLRTGMDRVSKCYLPTLVRCA